MEYFKNKLIWITGASSGIGKAMALALAQPEVELILSSRNEEALEQVKADCHLAKTVHVIPLDLNDHEGIEEVFRSNEKLLSTVDILFNNGGISQRSFAIDTDFAVYRRLIDVNYLGTVKLSLLLLPYFVKRNAGHFVVISSSAGKFGVPIRTGYSASKFALHGFFEALRGELYKTDICITMICPGYINTNISINALTSDGLPQGKMDQAQANGMPVEIMVKKVLKAVKQKKEEFLVGGFKETKLAVWISRFFPSIFRKIIARSRVT